MSDWLEYGQGLAAYAPLKSLGGMSVAAISYLFGLPNTASDALIMLMVFDFALGAAHGITAQTGLDPAKIMRGLRKFLVYGLAINIAINLDLGTGELPLGVSWQGMICGYLCMHEALSALTHLEAFGFPFPASIKDRLIQYRDNLGKMRAPQPVNKGE